jgi:hypothetical protein
MKYEIAGALIITAIALGARFIEEMRRVKWLKNAQGTLVLEGCEVFYVCCNVHLHLSLGMLGLLWSRHSEFLFVVPMFLFIIAGAITKGFVSAEKPEQCAWSDKVARLGMYIPNAFGLASVIYVIALALILAPPNSNPVIESTKSIPGASASPTP